MFLNIKNLNVFYGNAQVLHGINLSVKEGEMAFMVGRNGAGKTTLLKTIAGLISSFEGEIEVANTQINDWGAAQTARFGIRYIYQDKRVFGDLTVREHLKIAAKGVGANRKEAVDTALKIYPELENFLEIPASNLSGGQRQLLLIGRAFVGNPRLVLIDEPTEGLAAGIIKKVGKVLTDLKGETTMLIVEQNLGIVKELADSVLTLKEGNLTQEFDKGNIPDKKRLEEYL